MEEWELVVGRGKWVLALSYWINEVEREKEARVLEVERGDAGESGARRPTHLHRRFLR